MSTPKTSAKASSRTTKSAAAAAAQASDTVVRASEEPVAVPSEAIDPAIPASIDAAVAPSVETVAVPSVEAEPAPSVEAAAASSVGTVIPEVHTAAIKGVEQAISLTKGHVENVVKSGSAVFKGYEDVLLYNKANVEALVQSGSVLARGAQDLSKIISSLAQEQFEGSVSTTKSFFGVKTLRELLDLSSQVLKSNLEKLVAEGSRITSLSAKIAEEAFTPIGGRVEATVKTLSSHSTQSR